MWEKLMSFLSRIFGFKRKEKEDEHSVEQNENFTSECRVLECDIIEIEEIEENVEDSEENFII